MKNRKLILKTTIVILSLITITIILYFKFTNFVKYQNVIIIYSLLIASLIIILLFKKGKKLRNEIIDFLSFIFNTMAILLIIVTFFIMPAKVDGKSMEPTYYDNNRVFINMFNIKVFKDDIVVYKLNDELIIKRVAATKGDIISLQKVENDNKYYLVINENIYLNKNNQHYIVDEYILYQQIMDNNNYLVLEEGELILLGDNATNSSDSRNSGISHTNKIVGKVMGGIFG